MKSVSCHAAMGVLFIALPAMAEMPVGNPIPALVEKCSVIVDDGSHTRTQVLASLQVAAQTAGDQPFALPADAPAKVQAIMCGRSTSLVPRPGDYKVLVAGYPLGIVAPDGKRTGLLESVDGRLRYRMLDGELTEAELTTVQLILNASQKQFNESRPPVAVSKH